MIKHFILVLLTITSTCFADMAVYGHYATAYNVNSKVFSIDGYDFMEEDRPFPIVAGAAYIINEAGTEYLPGESFRKIIFIFDVNSKTYHFFKTRIINNTDTAIIVDVKENWRKTWVEQGDYGQPYVVLDASYDLTLEDGSVLQATLWFKDIYFLPGDEIVFKEELAGDFSYKFFRAQFKRDGRRYATFGDLGPGQESVTGVQRKDNPHGGQ